MVDLTNTGYQAAAATVSFTGTQTIDSLTDNEWSDESDAINNSTNKYTTVDLEIVLGSAAFTGVDSVFEVYLLPSVDGTNFPDWTGDVATDEQENDQHFVGSITTNATTAAQRQPILNVRVPAGLYKYAVRNKTNVTLAGSGNTLKWRPHSFAST